MSISSSCGILVIVAGYVDVKQLFVKPRTIFCCITQDNANILANCTS
ncbi:hypothetical protein [Nostoc sp. PA-18-2419]|nr:hypothetical protein [Nostoc sp. PA-18-2419]